MPSKRSIEQRLNQLGRSDDRDNYSLGDLILADCRAAHGHSTGIALSHAEVRRRLSQRGRCK